RLITANCTQSFVAYQNLQTTVCRHACFIFPQSAKNPTKNTEKNTPQKTNKNHHQTPTLLASKRLAQEGFALCACGYLLGRCSVRASFFYAHKTPKANGKFTDTQCSFHYLQRRHIYD